MKRLFGLSIFALLISCSSINKGKRSKENVELLKQLAYCECLDKAIDQYVGKDTVDNYYGELVDKMDFYGGYFIRTNNMFTLLDSAAKSIVTQNAKFRFAPNKAEGSYGKAGYKLPCLEFYKSKQLDSLTKVIAKRISDSIYIDSFYKNTKH